MRCAAACLMLMAGPPLLAQEAVPEKTLHAPGPMPDRIVLTWRKDPTRTQSVTWRTDTSVAKGLAEIAPAKAGPGFAQGQKKRSALAVTTPFKSDLSEAHFHTAHFEDLTPNTLYAYRVGDGVNWSEWNHFKTASEKPERFSFLYFGDAQHQIKEHWSRVVREAFRAAPDARFSIHAGDLINRASRDAEWGEWFQAAEWIHRTMPVIPAAGNHEYMGDGYKLPRYWSAQFALPEHGPVGGVFFLDFQGVRIVCLNTNEKLQEQADWLKGVLATNPQRWTILTFHHPIYSAAQGRDNPQMRKLWQPIFDRHKVDLVLQGHDHCYGRSGLLGHEGTRGGTVYVVSVSGPMFYELEDDKWMVRKGENVQLFQVITIDGDLLTFEARTATGELYDSFTLCKKNGEPNVLTDGAHHPRAVKPPVRTMPAPSEPRSWIPLIVIFLLVGLLIAMNLLRRRTRGTST